MVTEAFQGRSAVVRSSTAEQVAAAVTDRILQGLVRPGVALREQALADHFSISRNTLRESLRLLENRGLVRHQPHKGFEVSHLDEDDVADLYRVRRLLEPAGAECSRVASPAALAALSRSLEDLQQAYAAGEWPNIVDADLAFHGAIVGLAGSPRMNRTYELIESELRFVLSLRWATGDKRIGQVDQLVEEHRQIFEFITTHRTDAAKRLIRRHLDENDARTRAVVRARNADAGSPPAPEVPGSDLSSAGAS